MYVELLESCGAVVGINDVVVWFVWSYCFIGLQCELPRISCLTLSYKIYCKTGNYIIFLNKYIHAFFHP